MGWWTRSVQLNRSLTVSFVRLEDQSSGYPTSFQVYNGTFSSDGLHMLGTFREFTGGSFPDPISGKTRYAYTGSSQLYPWTATFSSTDALDEATPLPTGYGRWQLLANGFPGELQTRNATQMYVYGNGAIGNVASPPITYPWGEYPMYFIRALSVDLSYFQVYQGTYKTRAVGIKPGGGSIYQTTASGSFTEVIGGASGTNYDWNATYLGIGQGSQASRSSQRW
ncbi:hypothetical protein KSC_108240 [Ktedonobacter sp. SOSP1-52]|nr:hypothetical protein KSC_108240 [Ktedonobacter sp. SOSP1-52]